MRDIVHFRPLYAGADAGHYTLPAAVLDALQVVRALEQFQSEQSDATAPAAREALADAIVAAARAGRPLPSGAVYLKAEEADRAAEARASVLAEVIERRTMALATVTSGNALTIITDHLAPALSETLEEARPAVAALEPFDMSGPERMVNAADDVRASYAVLCDLAERYRAIRAARNVYRDELKPDYDTAGEFGELRNLAAVHPEFRRPQVPKPWPADPTARLAWLVSSPAKPWMPTPAEQDEMWLAAYGDAAKERAARTLAARAYAGQAV